MFIDTINLFLYIPR